MAVHVKCSRPYNIEGLKAMIERCGGRGPSPPRCPPAPTDSGPVKNFSLKKCFNKSFGSPRPDPRTRNSSSSSSPCCMTCPPMIPIPPCPPCPFICPTCTGYPCVTCASFPKPVPAPHEPPRPVIRTQICSGGLFYNGTIACCPNTRNNACETGPKCLPCIPIPGMAVFC